MRKEDLLNHIEAFVDGELDENAASQIRSLMDSDEDFAKQVELAVLIKNQFSTSEKWSAPASIEHAVIREIKSRSRRSLFESLFQKLGLAPSHPRRALLQVAGILAITLFAGTWAMNRVSTVEAVEYTEMEIAQAEEDVKWVMAFVSETGYKTDRLLKKR